MREVKAMMTKQIKKRAPPTETPAAVKVQKHQMQLYNKQLPQKMFHEAFYCVFPVK